jgi:hypothetical protein
MLNIQQVNGAFTGFQARPASHLAALAVLGSLAFIAHEGIVSLVPGALASALTVLFLAVAVLQWLALGRKEACEQERDTDRADAVITQAWIFGAIETALYAAGGLALLAAEGVAVYHWSGIAIAAACGAAAAYINFRVKWVSCDPVVARKSSPSNGGQRIQDVLFSEAAPALPAIDDMSDDEAETNILQFMKRVEHTHSKFEKDAAAAPARETPVRLRLAAKRIRVRAQRAAAKEAVAA